MLHAPASEQNTMFKQTIVKSDLCVWITFSQQKIYKYNSFQQHTLIVYVFLAKEV